MSTEKLPQTDSIQELSHFWDTHELTDFEDQLEEVTEPVFVRDTLVQIELSPTEVEAVKQAAKEKGVAYTDLIKEWVLERVQLA
jgi:predicted DNA binding CopG/RHH family protein